MRGTVPAPPSPPGASLLPGLASLVNVTTVLIGATAGVLLGNRLPVRTRELVTDALGLVTLLIAATSAMEVLSPPPPKKAAATRRRWSCFGRSRSAGSSGSPLRLGHRAEGRGARPHRRPPG